MTRRGLRSEHGQSTVELALVLPAVMAVLLAAVQVGIVVYCQIAVAHAAREVARALVVDPSADPLTVAAASTSLDPARVEVTVTYDGSIVANRSVVIVRVTYPPPAVAGVFEPILGDVRVDATAAMIVESAVAVADG